MDDDRKTGPRDGHVRLKRSIGLTGLVLYGLGVTIGAGIYVLVGETVLRAGTYAPAAFLLSAVVMAFTAASFAELSARVPLAAGEAAYVDEGFRVPWLTLLVGLSVLIEAMVAAAAIAVGASGYLGQLVALPQPALIVMIVLAMAALAAWGIRESVAVAGAMTLIEVLGLLVIIASGIARDPAALASLPATLMPPLGDGAAVSGVLAASLIAFFAYIGFDDIVNLVEESRNPARDLPWAIAISLVLVTVIYTLVAFVAVHSVARSAFAETDAPISLLFKELTGLPPLAVTLVAIMATMNGVAIIIIMAARVTYGLAQKGGLPPWLGAVSPLTRTPLNATAVVSVAVLGLALFVPLDVLAETTSAVMLAVFTMVNLALARIKLSGAPAPSGGFTVPFLVPAAGAASCLAFLASAVLSGG